MTEGLAHHLWRKPRPGIREPIAEDIIGLAPERAVCATDIGEAWFVWDVPEELEDLRGDDVTPPQNEIHVGALLNQLPCSACTEDHSCGVQVHQELDEILRLE
jgi:hypothetical protein